MERLHLEIDPRAVAEARAARVWYRERSALAAERFVAELDLIMEQIRTAPGMAPEYVHGTRVRRLGRFPYLVVYRECAGVVQVIAIAHARRRPGYWRGRMDPSESERR